MMSAASEKVMSKASDVQSEKQLGSEQKSAKQSEKKGESEQRSVKQSEKNAFSEASGAY